ncbi:hypothetical protein EGI22_14605 [Lacihabitans sp. LS3-19]|uniref:type IX secretion system protein PorG n=1 Tax=Lacihabitans sp. LS3-19 TaxID=2487335 RepID=UPI0020CE05F0|nr:DUF6089 family protein [Lacihabitans sp. LS3-19]MCP9769147.1 hypothetical protein [Lacihabitans sp. LS3-19]
MSKKTLIFVLISHFVYSQKLEIGAGAGPTYYKGDLQPTFRVFNPSIATNLFVRYNISKVFSIKGNASFGMVSGNDKRSGNALNKYRGLKFNNTLWDYYGQVEYNFLNFRTHNGRYEHSWTPYLFGGFGNYQHLKRKFDSRGNITISNKIAGPDPILPFGVGYKKILNGKWNFGVEFSTRVLLRKKNSDLFDGFGFSPDHPDPQSLYTAFDSGDKNFALLKYPNTKEKDKYFMVSFSVSYLFYKVHCPPGR